jgi:hypothetical protein
VAACYTSRVDKVLDVSFYTRPGCCLCDEAFAELDRLAARFPMRITVTDITADVEAHQRWWADIPVIQIGSTILRAPIEPSSLKAALSAGMGRPSEALR